LKARKLSDSSGSKIIRFNTSLIWIIFQGPRCFWLKLKSNWSFGKH